MDTHELERIRARADWLEQQQARYIELANKPYHECTEAENREALELERWVDGGFTLTSVRTLLAIIDAQQAVVAAAGEVDALIPATRHTDSDGYTYIWADGEGKLVAALNKLHGALKGQGDGK